jgi:transposase
MAGGVMKKKKRHYTPEFRREAVRLLRVSGKSSHQVSSELGISQSVLSRWKREADRTEGVSAVDLGKEEELRHLRKEVDRLRMERDILKKATAFFAKESS